MVFKSSADGNDDDITLGCADYLSIHLQCLLMPSNFPSLPCSQNTLPDINDFGGGRVVQWCRVS